MRGGRLVRILAFMGASAARDPASPDEPARGLRASDAERDEVAARLRDEFVAGRLSHDTFLHRIEAVLGARRRADLPPLLADLPVRYQGPPATSPYPLVERIRGALSRLTGPVRTGPPAAPPAAPPAIPARTASADGGAIRRTTSLRSASDPSSPLSLRFPRAAGGEFSIGRDARCDLAIADMTVSRRHATLERTPDGWLISDLESTNGTRVNGWRVRGKVAVRAGDLISFGDLEAVFVRDSAP